MTLLLKWLALACFLTALFQAEPARACVIVSTVDGDFGSHTSFTIRNQAQSTSSSSSGIRCDVKLASILSGDRIEATITSQNNLNLVNESEDKIEYLIYAAPNQQQPWLNGGTKNYASSTLLTILGIGIDGEVTFPIYFRTKIGSNVPAGVYEDTITVAWSWNYCTGIEVAGICVTSLFNSATARKTGTGSRILRVFVTVTNDCVISTTAVNFGSAPTAATFATATGTLSITCTKDINYTVGLGAGSNPVGGAATGRRQMAQGTHRLQYDLFKSNDQVWRTVGSERSASTLATGNTAQTFNVIGKVYPDQAMPAELGAYSDTVLVDVKY